MDTLKINSTGPTVELLQSTLKDIGYYFYAIDGIFGNRTQTAVIKFQKDNNLAPDGIVGERKYNEADLAELEDFYPPIADYSKKYDKNMVYDFFFKMYNLN